MQPEILDGLDAVAPAQWDALAGAQPCLSHAFLHALESSGAVGPGSGWQPCHLLLRDGGEVVAAAPLYVKHHSWGEYVFDWTWAEAYQRAGRDYYPKLLCAVPFTPVPGPRLLARDDDARLRLAAALIGLARDKALSSVHVLYPAEADMTALLAAGFLPRDGVQFHWFNRGFADFDDFLAALQRDKRKKIRQERRRVAEAGVTVAVKTGADIHAADWAFFHRCYRQTYRDHRSTPYLPPAFFESFHAARPGSCVLFIASQNGAPVAASLCLRDGERLYGRYWGCIAEIDCLHFELCYYAGIDYAIRAGLAVFEGGAQGEHKLARGFDPVPTRSAHWLADPRFARAIGDWLGHERRAMQHHREELHLHRAWR